MKIYILEHLFRGKVKHQSFYETNELAEDAKKELLEKIWSTSVDFNIRTVYVHTVSGFFKEE